MKALMRWLAVVFVLTRLGCAQAQEATKKLPSPELTREIESLQIDMMDERRDRTAIYASCVQRLQPWRNAALTADAGDFSALNQAWAWAQTMVICLYGDVGDGRPRATGAEARAWLAPWRDRVQQGASSDPLSNMLAVVSDVRILQDMGLRAEALALYERELSARIHRLQAAPEDALARDDIALSVRSAVGAWRYPQDVQLLQRLLEEGLGAANRQHLLLLHTMAYHKRFIGQPEASLALIERAAALTRQHHAQDSRLNAGMEEELAAGLSALGQTALAKQKLENVLKVHESQLPLNEFNLMRIETNLAGMALEMGAYDTAIAHADRSIEHSHRATEPAATAEARVARALREEARMWQGAADAPGRLREVLDETKATEMHIGQQAFGLVQFAAARGDTELLGWASQFTDLHIRRFRGPLQSDSALRPLMQAWRGAGFELRNSDVRDQLDRALAISLNGRSLGTMALTFFNEARERSTVDADAAIWLYKHGANTLQRLRLGLPSGEPELHRVWLGAHEADLRRFIGLLIDQGRLVEAEQALTALRDQEGQDYTRRSTRQQKGMEGQQLSFTPAESLRNAGLGAAVAQAQHATADADKRLEASDSPFWRTNYRDEQAQQAVDELAGYVRRLIDQAPATTRSLPRLPDASGPVPRGTARLTYFVRDHAVDIVLVTTRSRRHYAVPVERSVLNHLVQHARSVLSSPQTDPLPELKALHGLLLAPLEPALLALGIQHLHVVPDAALRYVPYAALHDGRRFAAQRYALSVRWSGSALPVGAITRLAQSDRTRRILAVGRVAGDADHAALPGVRQEMAAARRAGAQVLLDDAFTADTFRTALAQGPTMVHMASHFKLDPSGEEKSYLLLGDGQRLPLSELAALPWRGVQLALLSACDSGITLGYGQGQALVGFASALQQAGVAHVLATLWRVSDDATARWVQLFYESSRRPALKSQLQGQRAGEPVLNAERVAQTQRRWLQLHAGTPMAHPHHWGAFTWMEPQ